MNKDWRVEIIYRTASDTEFFSSETKTYNWLREQRRAGITARILVYNQWGEYFERLNLVGGKDR